MPGGAYRPLSEGDLQRIHDTALDLLANVGVGDPIPEVLRYTVPKGCVLGADNRLRIPRALMEDLIAVSCRSYLLHGVDPVFDHEVGGQRVYYGTSGEAVRILDYATQTYRPTRLVDLYDAARLIDRMQHIHNYGQPFDPLPGVHRPGNGRWQA